MEVDPNIVVLGVIEGDGNSSSPCTDMGVYILTTLVIDAMLLAVVIEGIDVCKPRLKGL